MKLLPIYMTFTIGVAGKQLDITISTFWRWRPWIDSTGCVWQMIWLCMEVAVIR